MARLPFETVQKPRGDLAVMEGGSAMWQVANYRALLQLEKRKGYKFKLNSHLQVVLGPGEAYAFACGVQGLWS